MGTKIVTYMMSRDLAKARKEVEELFHNARSVHYILGNPSFGFIFQKMSPELQAKMLNCIDANDKKGVRLCIKEYEEGDLYSMTMPKLRKLGSKYMIKNYSRMTRTDLIVAIRASMRENDEKTE
jgi:hypothetical protein